MTPPVHTARLDWTAQHPQEPSDADAPPLPRWKWWQWPHLLSLDAPVVAMTWLWWWNFTRHTHLPADRFAILGLAVWAIYVADRLADVSGEGRDELRTDRHRFHMAYGPALAAVLCVVLAVLALLTLRGLSSVRFLGGLGLLGAVAVYYWAIHHATRTVRPSLPKEAVVGGMFALGTAFFLIGPGTVAPGRLCLETEFFGALCFLNCGLITSWEQNPRDLQDPASLLRAFPRITARLNSGAFVLAISSAFAGLVSHQAALAPTAVSAGALWWLDRRQKSFSPGVLRVLADLVLLSPLLVAFIG